MHSFSYSKRGITLIELLVIIAIIAVLFAVLLPGFYVMKPHKARQAADASNQKQVALGFLQYIQDYDEKFPPAIGYVTASGGGSGGNSADKYAQSWGPDRKLDDGRPVRGLLSPYMKSNQLFIDPKTPKEQQHNFPLDYMYNDLLTGESQAALSGVAYTVLITNSERRFANVGHALSLDAPPVDAQFNKRGGCDAGHGATVGREARFRHTKGANFAFTDGHVKWFAGANDRIFFPPRESANRSAIDPVTKQQTAPIPGKSMTFGGRVYTGTFHLR